MLSILSATTAYSSDLSGLRFAVGYAKRYHIGRGVETFDVRAVDGWVLGYDFRRQFLLFGVQLVE